MRFIYLVGKISGRDTLNKRHREMPMRAVAVLFERLCKIIQKTSAARIVAIEKGFKFFIGYPDLK